MLQERDDITVYTFLMPILGPGSVDKEGHLVCPRQKRSLERLAHCTRTSRAPTALQLERKLAEVAFGAKR